MAVILNLRIIVRVMLALIQSMSRPCFLMPAGLLLVSISGFAAAVNDSGAGGHRVGLGDSRDHYELETYATQSEAILPIGPSFRTGGYEPAVEYDMNSAWLGLPPATFTLNPEEVALGRDLFFDRRLSANGTLSCGMCHIPEQGFTQQELATPVGHEGRSVRRNAPSLYNVAFRSTLFLDGREESLTKQVWSPLLAENEMANNSRAALLRRIKTISDYDQRFSKLYPNGLTEQTLGLAIAAYERSLVAANSPFDQWYFQTTSVEAAQGANYPAERRIASLGQSLSSKARAGFAIFTRLGCASCHSLNESFALFSDGQFHNTGVGYLRVNKAIQPARVQIAPGTFVEPDVSVETTILSDFGRREVTSLASDQWRYRTPTLRNISVTAPYMHDGSIGTLEEVVRFYEQGGGGDPKQDPRVQPFSLTHEERASLVKFLESLTSSSVHKLAGSARAAGIRDTGD